MPLTQQDSLYEHLHPLTTVMKQRFVENFSGGLDTFRWNRATYDATKSGTVAVADEVNGGIKLLTLDEDYGHVWYAFQTEQLNGAESTLSPQHFSPTGSVFIDVLKHTLVSGVGQSVLSSGGAGLVGGGSSAGRGDAGSAAGSSGFSHYCRGNFGSFSAKTTNAGYDSGNISSGVTYDNDWHCNKLELKASSADWTLDGVLKTTTAITTTLPTHDLAPVIGVSKWTQSGVVGVQCNYVECYNT
jgi:hypothetical protein